MSCTAERPCPICAGGGESCDDVDTVARAYWKDDGNPLPLSAPQPPPKPGTGVPTWDLIRADIDERQEFGRRKYGVSHQFDNGRDHLIDAYQEALDLCVYLRAEIERRKAER